MPLAVAHILTPLIASDVCRDFTKKGKKLLTKRMVLFAGIAGMLPDLDMLVFFVLSEFGNIKITSIHRTITHSLILPLAGLVLAAVLFSMFRKKNYYLYALMFSFGTLTHIILDATINGTVMPFYPASTVQFGMDLIKILVPDSVSGATLSYKTALLAGIDAFLLVTWLLYEEYKHKIKDYI